MNREQSHDQRLLRECASAQRGYFCTEPTEHRGPHIATRSDGITVLVWRNAVPIDLNNTLEVEEWLNN